MNKYKKIARIAAIVMIVFMFIIGCSSNAVSDVYAEIPSATIFELMVPLDDWKESDDPTRFLKETNSLVSDYSLLVHQRNIGRLAMGDFDTEVLEVFDDMISEENEQYAEAFSMLMHLRTTEFPIVPKNTADEVQFALHVHSQDWGGREDSLVEKLLEKEEYAMAFMAAREFKRRDSMGVAYSAVVTAYNGEATISRKRNLLATRKNMEGLLERTITDEKIDEIDNSYFKLRLSALEKLPALPSIGNYYDFSGNEPMLLYSNLEDDVVENLRTLNQEELNALNPSANASYCYSPLYIQSYVRAASEKTGVTFTQADAEAFLPNGIHYCDNNDLLNAVYVVSLVKIDDVEAAAAGEISGEFIGTGTGFIIDMGGYFLTNHHVISSALSDNGEPISDVSIIVFQNSEQIADPNAVVNTMSIVSYDKERDIALLKVNGSLIGATGAPPRSIFLYPYFEELSKGIAVTAMGNPSEIEFENGERKEGAIQVDQKSIGQVADSSVTVTQNLNVMFSHSAETWPGNSGGPVLLHYPHGDNAITSSEKNLNHIFAGVSTILYGDGLNTIGALNLASQARTSMNHLFGYRFLSEKTKNKVWLGVFTGHTAMGEVIVNYVFRDSPAERAGLKPGMRITKIEENIISNRYDIERFLESEGGHGGLYRVTVRNPGGNTEEEKYLVLEPRPGIGYSLFIQDNPGAYFGPINGIVSYKPYLYYSKAMKKWHQIYPVDEITQERIRSSSGEDLFALDDKFLIKSSAITSIQPLIIESGGDNNVELRIEESLLMQFDFVNPATDIVERAVRFAPILYDDIAHLIM